MYGDHRAAITEQSIDRDCKESRRAEFSTEDRKLGRRDLTPLSDCSCAFDLEMVP